MYLNTQIIFTEKYLPTSKPIIVAIPYRLPDKIDFVNRIDQIFSQFNILENQEQFNILKNQQQFSILENQEGASSETLI